MIGDALTILGHVHAAGADGAASREAAQVAAQVAAQEAASDAYERALALRRESGQQHLVRESLAGLVRVALAAGDLEEALTHVDAILAYLADRPLHGPEEPERVVETCRQVLARARDPRASSILNEEGYK